MGSEASEFAEKSLDFSAEASRTDLKVRRIPKSKCYSGEGEYRG